MSIVCACRNEQGHIAELIDRVPDFGVPTELIFVEGNSTDDTRGEILRQIEAHPERDIRFVPQTGKGKGDAVRTGFAAAKHDVLMILDGDLSVLPEDLPKFHRGLVDGRAELVNGSRLVYDMEPGAMRFLNMIGNRVFARLLKGIMGQQVKDTLCGTKVLLKRDYDRIAAGRSYFGDFDPFGDFDLLFGAAQARPEDRRPAGALPPAHVRRDEHQPLAPRRAAPPDDALRVLEIQSRTAHAPRQSERARRRGVWERRAAALAFVLAIVVAAVVVFAQPLRSPWWTYADADASYTGAALNLVAGYPAEFVDHPGLPLTEAAALAFGADALLRGNLSRADRRGVRRRTAARPRPHAGGLPRPRCAPVPPRRARWRFSCSRGCSVTGRGASPAGAALARGARPDSRWRSSCAPTSRSPSAASSSRTWSAERWSARSRGLVRRGAAFVAGFATDGEAARDRAARAARRRRAVAARRRARCASSPWLPAPTVRRRSLAAVAGARGRC